MRTWIRYHSVGDTAEPLRSGRVTSGGGESGLGLSWASVISKCFGGVAIVQLRSLSVLERGRNRNT